MRLTSEMMDDIRRRINPQYQNITGTESYERFALVEAIDQLRLDYQLLSDDYKQLQIDNERLRYDRDMKHELAAEQIQALEDEVGKYKAALERIRDHDRTGTTGHWYYDVCGGIALKALGGGE